MTAFGSFLVLGVLSVFIVSAVTWWVIRETRRTYCLTCGELAQSVTRLVMRMLSPSASPVARITTGSGQVIMVPPPTRLNSNQIGTTCAPCGHTTYAAAEESK